MTFTDGRYVWFNAAQDLSAPLEPTGTPTATYNTTSGNRTSKEQRLCGELRRQRAQVWFGAACDALAHYWGVEHSDSTEQISCHMQHCFADRFQAFLADA